MASENQQSHISEVWTHAQECFQSFAHQLPPFAQYNRKFGTFKLNVACFDLPFMTIETINDEVISQVAFLGYSVGLNGDKRVLTELSVRTEEGHFNLRQRSIEMQELRTNNKYPRRTYSWTAGVFAPDTKGSLEMFRADLSDTAFVQCDLFDNTKLHRIGSDADAHNFTNIPDSLNVGDDFLNQSVPWTIDYDAKAREIVNKARLDEVASAVRKGF